MPEIRVTIKQLQEKADVLEMLNRRFRAEVEKMAGYEQELSTMWEGDAQAAFRNAFNNDKAKMEAFAINVDRYVLALRENAQRYEQAEAQATNIATVRKS